MGIKYSDSANLSVRVFLRELGVIHDRGVLGRPGNSLTGKKLKDELRDLWSDKCSYCSIKLGPLFDVDHVVPINQEYAGLHCIANVVPACKPCNKEKKAMSLAEFLSARPDIDQDLVLEGIESWYKKWGGNPSGLYIPEAQLLYKDVTALLKRHVEKVKG